MVHFVTLYRCVVSGCDAGGRWLGRRTRLEVRVPLLLGESHAQSRTAYAGTALARAETPTPLA